MNALGDKTDCEVVRERSSRTGSAAPTRPGWTLVADPVGIARSSLVTVFPAITIRMRSNRTPLLWNRNSYADLSGLSNYLTVDIPLRLSSGHRIWEQRFE